MILLKEISRGCASRKVAKDKKFIFASWRETIYVVRGLL